MNNIEDLSEEKKIELIETQIKRYIKYKGLHSGTADDIKAIALTEGYSQLHLNLPKEYNPKEIYNAIERGCTKFLKHEAGYITLSDSQRKKFNKIDNNTVRLGSTVPLERTEWGQGGSKNKNLYNGIGRISETLKMAYRSLKRQDRIILIEMYRDVFRGKTYKRKTYGEVASKLSLTSETVRRSHDRVREALGILV